MATSSASRACTSSTPINVSGDTAQPGHRRGCCFEDADRVAPQGIQLLRQDAVGRRLQRRLRLHGLRPQDRHHRRARQVDRQFRSLQQPRTGDFRVGQFKTPVGWEEASSSSATTFLERALPVQAANTDRRIGADWSYYGIPNWMLYAAYFGGGDLNGKNKGHGPAARVVWNPFNHQPGAGSREESNVIHLGIAASQRGPRLDHRRPRHRPRRRRRASARARRRTCSARAWSIPAISAIPAASIASASKRRGSTARCWCRANT